MALGLTHDRRWSRARLLLLDAARDRLFLADAAYIAYYTIVPRAIGGRLFSDPMGRISFILFLVVAMPIGVHHLFADPQVGSGFKFLHSVFTALVTMPTLLTVFTICASVEIAAACAAAGARWVG